MKKHVLLLLLSIFNFTVLFAQELSYYLPDSVSYNPAIPTPESVIGHKVGEWHVTHDRLVFYMRMLDNASDRIRLEEIGKTYEGRPQVMLVITSPKNHGNLEQIKSQHVALTDPARSSGLNTENMPLVVWMGYSIHGNEPSGSNASMLSAYYLAAAQGANIDRLLENTVILLDPSFNPDGLNKFATWVNSNKSRVRVTDPSSREFNEVWPGSRTNHYWFDLNRDWLPVQHRESVARVTKFHEWKPNILTDHHEMGTNSTFFFQPGVPSRVNPLTPMRNQELTGKIANFHAKFLDRIGSLYFTKEDFDDFYYGKGSTYPDINGGVGILFEQASSRGHAQESDHGVLTFPFTIRNQFTATLSTLEAGVNLRRELLDHQRSFYQAATQLAAADPVKGYIFGDKADRGKTFHLLDMLRRHQIAVYEVKNRVTADKKDFEKGSAYVVPLDQPQYRLIKTIFQKETAFKDSLFYDVSAWTMPLAFGLPYSELRSVDRGMMGAAVEKVVFPKGEMVGETARQGKSQYAYLFEWDEYYAPRALYALLDKGIIAKVGKQPFEVEIEGKKQAFDYGTIMIPVKMQPLNADELYNTIKAVAEQNGLRVYALQTGLATNGMDLGSRYYKALQKPQLLMLTGAGVSSNDAGEIWHLLDQRFDIPVSMVDINAFGGLDLGKYTTIVLADGSYGSITKGGQEKLRTWIQHGGTLITFKRASNWASAAGLSAMRFRHRQRVDTTLVLPYILLDNYNGAQEIGGAIFEAKLDLTHPLGYGYNQPTVSIFKDNDICGIKSHSPYANPLIYTATPLQSGYISAQNRDLIKNSSVVNINAIGQGMVISVTDNLNFRAFWFGGNKLFLNAIFFGKIIEAGSAR